MAFLPSVRLPCHERHELLHQERLLALRDRQADYVWQRREGLPAGMRAQTLKDLPSGEHVYLEKYHDLPWDIDTAVEEATVASPPGRPNFDRRSTISFAKRGSVSLSLGGSRKSLAHTQSLPGRRMSSTPTGSRVVLHRDSLTVKAEDRWRTFRQALQSMQLTQANVPQGSKGDMCMALTEDIDFGRHYTQGKNPFVLRQCREIPVNFPVDLEEMEGLLERNISLAQEMEVRHDDVIKWKHFPRYWPLMRGIHRSPVNSPHKGQWRGALMFSLICAWINGWVNNDEAGDLRRHRAHYNVIVMHYHESRRRGCLVAWFCNQLIATPCNETASPPSPDPLCIPGVLLHAPSDFQWWPSCILPVNKT